MPSQLHEVLLLLFRNRPELAPELLREALALDLPAYTEVRMDSADLTEVQPAEYRADLVVLLVERIPVLGIVVEVQLAPDNRKQFAWPVYVAGLRARLECPVCLLVITAEDSVAWWAARSIEIGGGNVFTPLVIGPSRVPEVTDELTARADPELAVFSAVAHGRDADAPRVARIAMAALGASLGLDPDRARLYGDLVMAYQSEAVRKELLSMDPAKYEYQSDFARRYVAQGREEGRIEGRAALVRRQLEVRFGALPDDAQARLAAASIEELDGIGERLLSAQTLQEALGTH